MYHWITCLPGQTIRKARYEHRPKIAPGSEEMKQFIEMCFDPQSPLNEKLKQTLLEMMEMESK